MRKTLMLVAGTQVTPPELLQSLQSDAELNVVVPVTAPAAVTSAWRELGIDPLFLPTLGDASAALVNLGVQRAPDALMTFDAAWSGPVARAAAQLGLTAAQPDLDSAACQVAFTQAGGRSTDVHPLRNLNDLKGHLSALNTPALLRLPTGWGNGHHCVVTPDLDVTDLWSRWTAAVTRLREQGHLPQGDHCDPLGVLHAQYPSFMSVLHVTGLVQDQQWTPVALFSSSAQTYPCLHASLHCPCTDHPAAQDHALQVIDHTARQLHLPDGAFHVIVGRDADHHLWLLDVQRGVSTDVAQLITLVTGTDFTRQWIAALLRLPTERSAALPSNPPPTVAVPLSPVNAQGEPWRNTPHLNTQVNFRPYVQPDVHVDVRWHHPHQHAQPVSRYTSLLGQHSQLGTAFLRSTTVASLAATRTFLQDNAEWILGSYDRLPVQWRV